MPDVLADIAEDESLFRIKTFSAERDENGRRKATIFSKFGVSVLVADAAIFEKSSNEGALNNFTLAHEFSHLALGHHDDGSVSKHFEFRKVGTNNARVAETDQEFETDFAAVVFLCGPRLLQRDFPSSSLARWAKCDQQMIEKARKICFQDSFIEALSKLDSSIGREVF